MNQFIIVNPKQCLGCHACEVACVMAHNDGQHVLTADQFFPRIHVIKSEQINTAITCHHCEDAPCLQGCPNGAIQRLDDGIHIDQQRCIGCKACEVNCPFGAIEVVTRPIAEHQVKAMALKCDLCVDREGGPACVENCPNQALSLMTEQMLSDSAAEKRRNNALQSALPWHTQSEPVVDTAAPSAHRINKVTLLEHSSSRQDPDKIDLELRKKGFDELYITFDEKRADSQSGRCLTCGEHSICEWKCPLHNHIPQWIRLVQEGRIDEAVELSHQTNCMPEITGRICPQDRLCESGCTLKEKSGSVTIGNIERFISEQAFAKGWKPDLSGVMMTDRRVAIIGAGPAGLACADVLIRHGVKPVVFDRHAEIGGLLTFGIPSFKLDKSVLARRREIFTEMGIEFRLGCDVGTDVQLSDLLSEYDAVFVGVGTYKPMAAGLANEDAPGVFEALPYLMANTRSLMNLPEDPKEPYINLSGQQVVVLGGGDTAMDCVRTAIRQGATRVTCAYRRDEANMPGSRKEVKNAKEEGVEFEFYVQPINIELDETGAVSGIRMLRTQLGEPGADGRRRPEPIEGSEFVMPADAVIVAFGFLNHEMPWLVEQGVQLGRWHNIDARVDSRYSYQTSNPKIFAGGDAVRGADLVVTALADGRHAAEGILNYIQA
ncbi:formate-dependent uric acid utilization protein AegA [Celerinatantimonas sp. YJH-8]|uniref:formate-dependent uric acid utilization protein AegA n=1 Tax=Celerinatantimonas sp. YJH-8 TaxID=3228714 RepID=UPI0038C69119